jgi:hypothetical protein
MNVRELLASVLKANGFEGLCRHGCACQASDLMTCRGPVPKDCVGAHLATPEERELLGLSLREMMPGPIPKRDGPTLGELLEEVGSLEAERHTPKMQEYATRNKCCRDCDNFHESRHGGTYCGAKPAIIASALKNDPTCGKFVQSKRPRYCDQCYSWEKCLASGMAERGKEACGLFWHADGSPQTCGECLYYFVGRCHGHSNRSGRQVKGKDEACGYGRLQTRLCRECKKFGKGYKGRKCEVSGEWVSLISTACPELERKEVGPDGMPKTCGDCGRWVERLSACRLTPGVRCQRAAKACSMVIPAGSLACERCSELSGTVCRLTGQEPKGVCKDFRLVDYLRLSPEALRGRRMLLGLTIPQAAKLMGISAAYLRGLESGKRAKR